MEGHHRLAWGEPVLAKRALGLFRHGDKGQGKSLMVEDFWLFAAIFSSGNEPTMKFIRGSCRTTQTINNSEFRLRYPDNHTGFTWASPQGHAPKYATQVSNGEITA